MLFQPCHIVPAVKLPAGVVPHACVRKAQSALHADALFVRQGHAAVQVAQPLQLEQVDQARQHGRAHTMSVGALCQIDGQLRIPVVRRALTNAVRVGVTHDHAVLLADEIRKRSRRFADTVRKRLSRRHIIFKRDGCIRYVRLVNLQKRFCIVFCCLANYKFAH